MVSGTMTQPKRMPSDECRMSNGASRHSPLAIRHSRRFSSIWKEARRYLVGGVNSPVRAFGQINVPPVMLASGRGAFVTDVRGRRWLDLVMGWGSLILGHNHPAVVRAVTARGKAGLMLGFTHPEEATLARLIVEAVPGVEQVRFTVSGTEACLTAIRLARAVTGRSKLVLIEGGYHGHGESFMARGAGTPVGIAQDIIHIPFNDAGAVEAVLRRFHEEVAAVIVEPVPANMGVIVPEPGFLGRLRALTEREGTLLMFDEVVTGFRLGRGGAQGYAGVRPDLTTFGKIIGGGLPIGALGGPRELMRRLAPEGEVFHGGTFAGHPLSMAAGIATLIQLQAQPPYERMEWLAQRVAEGLITAATERQVPIQINRMGSMLTVFFAEGPIRHAVEARASDRRRFARWARAMMSEGILIPPSPFEAWFLSSAHEEVDVERIIRAGRTAFRRLR